MIDPSIIEEAYAELNEVQEVKTIKEEKLVYKPRKIQESEAYKRFLIENPAFISMPEEGVEVERDPVIERMRKLISDIQSMLFKLDDNVGDEDAGKEDDDIRRNMYLMKGIYFKINSYGKGWTISL